MKNGFNGKRCEKTSLGISQGEDRNYLGVMKFGGWKQIELAKEDLKRERKKKGTKNKGATLTPFTKPCPPRIVARIAESQEIRGGKEIREEQRVLRGAQVRSPKTGGEGRLKPREEREGVARTFKGH